MSTMDAAAMKKSLTDQGIAATLADTMVRQALKLQEREAKAKEPKAKKGGKWFPGMADSTPNVEADVKVTTKCMTCGDIVHETIKMKLKPNSPRTQKLAVSICGKCPDFFRELDKETLIALLMLKEHPALRTEHTSNLGQVRIAKHMTPEQVVSYKVAK